MRPETEKNPTKKKNYEQRNPERRKGGKDEKEDEKKPEETRKEHPYEREERNMSKKRGSAPTEHRRKATGEKDKRPQNGHN